MIAVKLANEILDMQDEIVRLNREVTRLMKIEADYYNLIAADTEHHEKMMGGWLALLLSDRIKIEPGNPEGIPLG